MRTVTYIYIYDGIKIGMISNFICQSFVKKEPSFKDISLVVPLDTVAM